VQQLTDNREQRLGDHAGRLVVPAQTTAEGDAGLMEGIFALATLSAARLSLEDLLTQVAELAVQAIPGADGAGLLLIEDDHPDTVVTSTGFAREVEDIQHGINEGPCITAAATRGTVRSGSLSAEDGGAVFLPAPGAMH